MKALALLLAVLGLAACKPESARRADRAAKEVVEQRDDVVEAARKIPDQPVEATKAVLAEAGELVKAAHEFEHQKSRRLAALGFQLDTTGIRASLVAMLARDMPITDAARGEINEKLTRLDARLAEATNVIEGLSKVHIDGWHALDSEATEAMKRLADAANAAWDALEDAPHIAPGAS